ncbi:MAG TPA: conjugal transfer protein TrbF [Terriglobia bacterium]|nr:conjugal transfer protein TrbF [Terriglobia bacterium]
MYFRRSIQRYGRTPEPVTPYQRAAQVWDERIGSARVQARNWRLMSFLSLALASGLAGSLVWQSTQSRVVPYVVEVDNQGAVRAVGPAAEAYKPTEAEVAWYLGRFITNVRSLSLDPILVRQNWLQAYDFATEQAATFLNAYAQANDPFKAVGERSVAVEITSVVPVTGTSYQVKWTEQSFKDGNPAGTENWTAILTIVTDPPKTAEAVRKNPLGLYVDGIAWSRELTPNPRP